MKPKKHKETPPGCRACQWTGRIFVKALQAMGYCSCARGVWREQISAKRDAGLPV